MKDLDLALYLIIGMHKAVKNFHKVLIEYRLLMADHLRYQFGLFVTEFSQSLQLIKQLRQLITLALVALVVSLRLIFSF